MELFSANDGKFAVIKTKEQFTIVIGEVICGPYPYTKEYARKVMKIMQELPKD